MYYEDEQSLYHYSYRKNDESIVEPVLDTRAHAAPTAEEPAPQPAPAPKRHKRLGLKITLLALCCALLGGAVGAAAAGGLLRNAATKMGLLPPESGGEALIQVSSRAIPEITTVKVDGKTQMTMSQVYAATVGSTVSINTSITTNAFGQTVESAASSGSGFIITQDGYIVTNYHVIEDASAVKVTLYSGETYDAEVIGGDEDYDIAVLKIEAAGLQSVVLGDSEELLVGETIAAIGNPLGELTFSMSQGIVSCVNRAINVDGTPFNMIQVDCSVNPGNSGGPLVNTYGEVVGIVSAKYSNYSTTSVEGLGFAIPINDVIAMIEDIMTNGYITNKPYLGVSAGTLTASMAQQYRYDISEGVFIYSVEKGSAAEKAGLKMGDVILKVDDRKITSMGDLTAAKKSYSAGDTVTLSVYRGGETIPLILTFDVTPAKTEEDTEEQQQQQPQQPYGGNNGGGYYYYDPFDFFNDFFRGW